MEGSAGSFSGTAANVVTLAEEPWVLKSRSNGFTLKSFTSHCTKSKLASFMGSSSFKRNLLTTISDR